MSATGDHPCWVNGSGWTNVHALSIGDEFVDIDKRKLVLEGIHELENDGVTYNITVFDFNTFFAGPQKVLVHNSCVCRRIPLMGADDFPDSAMTPINDQGLSDAARSWDKHAGRMAASSPH